MMWGYSVVSSAGNLKNVNGIMKENYVQGNLKSCARRLDLETVGHRSFTHIKRGEMMAKLDQNECCGKAFLKS